MRIIIALLNVATQLAEKGRLFCVMYAVKKHIKLHKLSAVPKVESCFAVRNVICSG